EFRHSIADETDILDVSQRQTNRFQIRSKLANFNFLEAQKVDDRDTVLEGQFSPTVGNFGFGRWSGGTFGVGGWFHRRGERVGGLYYSGVGLKLRRRK